MNAQQAINRSISHTEIVTLDWDVGAYSDLLTECDDWVEGNDAFEFWGDADGAEWRVHVSRMVEGGDTAEDRDTGRVMDVDGEQVTVSWEGSLERTTQHASALRPAS